MLLRQGECRAPVRRVWLVLQEAVRQAPALRPPLPRHLPCGRLQELQPDRYLLVHALSTCQLLAWQITQYFSSISINFGSMSDKLLLIYQDSHQLCRVTRLLKSLLHKSLPFKLAELRRTRIAAPAGKYACACGAVTERRRCEERSFQCGRVCGKTLGCGRCACQRVCHSGACGDCPRAGVRTCPCGKVSASLELSIGL